MCFIRSHGSLLQQSCSVCVLPHPCSEDEAFQLLHHYNMHKLLLQTRAADPGCRPMVLQTLDAMQALGFTVVRIWAFNDGPGWMSLQPQAGGSKGDACLAHNKIGCCKLLQHFGCLDELCSIIQGVPPTSQPHAGGSRGLQAGRLASYRRPNPLGVLTQQLQDAARRLRDTQVTRTCRSCNN